MGCNAGGRRPAGIAFCAADELGGGVRGRWAGVLEIAEVVSGATAMGVEGFSLTV